MIRKSVPSLAVIALLACSTVSAQIRVEESTGTAVTRNGAAPIQIIVPGKTTSSVQLTAPTTTESTAAPIDINLPSQRASRVKLTTAPESSRMDTPAPDGESIELTPAQFKEMQQAERDAATTSAETLDEPSGAAPSGIPVPTNEPVEAVTGEDAPEPENTLPADAATSLTVEDEPLSDAPDQEQPIADTADGTTTEFLPPAELGKEKTIMRGGEELPLRPELLTTAALNITVPDVYQTTLTNGIHFYHYENHDLPRVRVSLLISAGKNADPADKVGLAEITARTMRAGGAGGKSGDEIDQQLEQIGSDLEFNVDHDHVAGSLFSLTEKSGEAMALLADILIKPEFDEQKFEQQRARALEQLRRQNDQPAEISKREFKKIIYGPDHPLARTPTSATINTITRDDVRKFHDARYRPSTVWVGISGDITQEDARKLLDSAFGSWKRPDAEKVVVPPLDETTTTGGVYLTKKATAQSQIRLGHFGIERRSPKAYAVNVMNSIYGTGGFSSRLMNQVRTKHGYVYGVGGGILSDDPVGLFLAAAASQPATTVAAINEILNVTRGIINDPIEEEEVETARRDVIFTFVNQFDTPAETIMAHMLHDYRGYAPDYLKTFTEHIRNVTVQDVKQVAAELLHPDRIKIYVIGNESQLDAPLDEFGPVQDWHLDDYSEN